MIKILFITSPEVANGVANQIGLSLDRDVKTFGP
jgi:hypothetical protein